MCTNEMRAISAVRVWKKKQPGRTQQKEKGRSKKTTAYILINFLLLTGSLKIDVEKALIKIFSYK